MSIYILVGFVIVFSEIITYKIIKKIDKKERQKLYEWELEYIEKIKKIKQEEYECLKKIKDLEKGKKNDIDSSKSVNNSTNTVSSKTK